MLYWVSESGWAKLDILSENDAVTLVGTMFKETGGEGFVGVRYPRTYCPKCHSQIRDRSDWLHQWFFWNQWEVYLRQIIQAIANNEIDKYWPGEIDDTTKEI